MGEALILRKPGGSRLDLHFSIQMDVPQTFSIAGFAKYKALIGRCAAAPGKSYGGVFFHDREHGAFRGLGGLRSGDPDVYRDHADGLTTLNRTYATTGRHDIVLTVDEEAETLTVSSLYTVDDIHLTRIK